MAAIIGHANGGRGGAPPICAPRVAIGESPHGGADGQQQDPPEALVAARFYLASVAEELAGIQESFGDHATTATAAPQSMPQAEREEAWRAVQHLQVDLREARERVQRLLSEKEDLLAAQTRLEARLRASQQGLAEAARRLRHRELDRRLCKCNCYCEGAEEAQAEPALEELVGERVPLPPIEPELRRLEEEGEELVFAVDAVASPALQGLMDTYQATGAFGRRIGKRQMARDRGLAGPQSTALLRAAEAKLQMEHVWRHQAEKTIRQERERSEELAALVERQRRELAELRVQRKAPGDKAAPMDGGGGEVRMEPGTAPEPNGELNRSLRRLAGSALLVGRRQQSAPLLLPKLNQRRK